MFTLICGHPRAGKTTYSKQYENVLHLDTDGLYSGVVQKLRKICTTITVEGIYNRRRQRTEILNAYKGTEKKVCIWLDTAKHIRQERTGAKLHDLPFEPPTLSEGWDEIIIIRGEHEQRISRETET